MAAETVTDAASVVAFGSVARGEAHRDSDIDLIVIAAQDWGGRAALPKRQTTSLVRRARTLVELAGDVMDGP